MSETRYMISDAAKKIDVEPHVLRYWEEELEMEIQRNEMGHRYYREEDIETMKAVKRLKDQGFQLKAIKMLLPDIRKVEQMEPGKLLSLKEQLELVMGLTPVQEMAESGGEETKEEEKEPEKKTAAENAVSDSSLPAEPESVGIALHMMQEDKILAFRDIMSEIVSDAVVGNNGRLTKSVSESVSDLVIKEMDYLVRLQEDKEEERFKQLDRTIRDYQQGKMQIAAAKEGKKKRKSLFFRKNKKRG